MPKNKRKRAPKTVLRLPDLEQSKSAVLNSLASQTHLRQLVRPKGLRGRPKGAAEGAEGGAKGAEGDSLTWGAEGDSLTWGAEGEAEWSEPQN
jgi:hypothetical protein